jgi:hypothetical protein
MVWFGWTQFRERPCGRQRLADEASFVLKKRYLRILYVVLGPFEVDDPVRTFSAMVISRECYQLAVVCFDHLERLSRRKSERCRTPSMTLGSAPYHQLLFLMGIITELQPIVPVSSGGTIFELTPRLRVICRN